MTLPHLLYMYIPGTDLDDHSKTLIFAWVGPIIGFHRKCNFPRPATTVISCKVEMVNFSMNIIEISVMAFQALILMQKPVQLFICLFWGLGVVCGLWNPHSLCQTSVPVSVVIASLHAYRKHVRSWDQGKVVRVRKQALCSVVVSLEHEMCFLVLINKKFISQK